MIGWIPWLAVAAALQTAGGAPVGPETVAPARAVHDAVFAFLIAFGSSYVGRAFNRLTQIERWVRGATGVVFILVGIYYCLAYIYGVKITG